ncbi:RNA polymerase sigma factor [Carboxylicivirga sp. M1479]|uniref:RNA polymerase sigma factor n=1 Tax=Carboxylicivirga sp. M1479 TaxID=2594476 RepID=UPI00117844C9|nr:RNA polymerase sigma-70 factor [Carboxylicivirga sp. M1479]TRX70507.1 RNA polymerase sigma-70 factor [Carboxylicivirga sp. M1479]
MSEVQKITNKKEFEQFFMVHHHEVLSYALKFVKSKDVASDIVQEAFIKLWENKKHILATVSLKAYLFKMVYNLSLNYLAQLKNHAQHHASIHTELLEMEMDYYKEEKSLLQEERITSLRKMLKELPKGCYEVIDLSRLQGFKNKEIAEKLAVPVRTIETRIYRCISKLKYLFEKSV